MRLQETVTEKASRLPSYSTSCTWAERSPTLAITVAFYLAAALVVSQCNDSGLAGSSTRDAGLSLTALRLLGLLPALVPLVGRSGAWLTQRLHLPAHGAADDHCVSWMVTSLVALASARRRRLVRDYCGTSTR